MASPPFSPVASPQTYSPIAPRNIASRGN